MPRAGKSMEQGVEMMYGSELEGMISQGKAAWCGKR